NKLKKFNVDDMDEPCEDDQDKIKKDNEANRIMNIDSEVTSETTIVSKVELKGYNQKKEKKMETISTKPKEIVDEPTRRKLTKRSFNVNNLDRLYSLEYCHQNKIRVENNGIDNEEKKEKAYSSESSDPND
ncbi:25873_t:CDS:2, partial [Gigaspora margarita]